ncbi:MAG: MT-A70 family methyltransferase [Candidatus Acidiferrales bacterium]
MNKYQVIYADPPWRYHDKASAGKRGACYKYPVLGTEDVCALPVADLADDNCVLFMWATFPMLPDALQVMKAWGFSYKTASFVWVKSNKKTNADFFRNGELDEGERRDCFAWREGKAEASLRVGSASSASPGHAT